MDNDAFTELGKNDARVLLLPPTTRDAQAIQKVLATDGIDCVICVSMENLCREIGHGAGAVCLSEEAIIEEADGLINCIKSQPVWSDLGTIILSRSGTELPRLAGLVPLLGNVTVLERPVRVTTLLSLVRSCLRARKRQYEMRSHLALLDHADHELRSSSERLALAVQTGKLGVWELDLTSKEMNCSDTCKANYGRRSDEAFTYADLWASIHEDDVERVRTIVKQAIEQNVDYDTEYRCIWPDSTTHCVLMRGRMSQAENENAQRLVGVTLDITEQKNAEELRASLLDAERNARTEAERASRMKDEFLATLSHELRTPLNAILGWSHILSLGKSNETQLTEGLRTIERNARAQTQIIEDLLDMSRIISGKVRLDVQRVSLANVVQAAVDTVRPTADAKGVRIQVVLDPSPVPVSGDPNRLQQVFWNLLSNAIKFTPKGGRTQVLLERVNSHLEVSVIDTGQGISPDFLPHVFDRFRQADASTSRQHGGLGLGLAIVKQLVELHGGTVRAKSLGAGRGSTFIVALPSNPVLAEPDLGERRHPRAESDLSALRDADDDITGLRVLIVDDEIDSRNLIKRLVEDRKAVAFTAASPAEAIQLMKAERVDVLVSDIGMPGEDGYSFIRKVRQLDAEQGGSTPAIALTAYARAEDRVHAARAGFQQHIAKPVEPAELVAVIANLVRK